MLDNSSYSDCSETINTWRFCYHIENLEDECDDCEDYIGFWRLQENSFYELVEGSMLNLQETIKTLDSIDYACIRHVVEEPFEVLKGDVIGALVYSNTSLFSLVASVSDGELWWFPMQNYEVDIEVNGSSISDYGLYVEASFTGTM